MLAAGILGGIVNSFLADPLDEHLLPWWQHLAVGITASFMVPLFLNMISGDLIDKIRGIDDKAPDYSKLFVLAGFCLVAAVSSRAFIRSLSERVLQEVKSAKKKANEAKEEAKEVKSVVASWVEPEAPDALDALAASDQPTTDADELKVLKAMASSPYPLRSITGIAKDSGLSKAVVNSTLTSLLSKGLIGQTLSASGQPRWYLTPEGRKAASVD
jgi:hypothetical protein